MSFIDRDVKSESDLILEGQILHNYRDFIPGTSPPQRGIHWLFDFNTVSVIKDPFFTEDSNRQEQVEFLIQLGFWTLEGIADEHLSCDIGSRIRASLEFVNKDSGYIVLKPIQSRYGVVDVERGVSMFGITPNISCPNYGLPRDYGDMGIIIQHGLLGTFKEYTMDLFNAVSEWNSKTGTNITIDARIFNDPHAFGHYSIGFSRNLPAQTLGRAVYAVNGIRPNCYSKYDISINQNINWSPPQQRAGIGQYDMLSVLIHEIGHAVGLAHLQSNSANIMYDSIAPGISKTLQTDDINCMKQLI